MACADPELCKQICGNPVGCSDTAYARLVMELLPAGELASCPASCLYSDVPVCIAFNAGLCAFFPCRPARADDGGDDRRPHVLSDLHLQQLQHHFHHGPVEEFQGQCIRVGAYVSGQVRDQT